MKPLIFTKEHEERFIKRVKWKEQSDSLISIMVDGRFITLKSGKNAWKTIGHAKNALKTHFGNVPLTEHLPSQLNEEFDDNEYSHRGNEIWNCFINHLEKQKILRFVTYQNN